MINNSGRVLSKIDGVQFFVSQTIYERRNRNFIKGLKAARVNLQLTIGVALSQQWIYEVELINRGIQFTRDDFILPEYKNAGAGGFTFDLHHFNFMNKTYPNEVQRKLLPKPGEILYCESEEETNVPDFLVTKAEKEIKETYFKAHKLYQESYFLDNKSN